MSSPCQINPDLTIGIFSKQLLKTIHIKIEGKSMTHGGRRPGAGRKPGSLNRFSEALLAKASQSGTLPVEYLLETMRDQSLATWLRIDAAKAAAPCVHHKLSTISVDVTRPEVTHEEWLESVASQS